MNCLPDILACIVFNLEQKHWELAFRQLDKSSAGHEFDILPYRAFGGDQVTRAEAVQITPSIETPK